MGLGLELGLVLGFDLMDRLFGFLIIELLPFHVIRCASLDLLLLDLFPPEFGLSDQRDPGGGGERGSRCEATQAIPSPHRRHTRTQRHAHAESPHMALVMHW